MYLVGFFNILLNLFLLFFCFFFFFSSRRRHTRLQGDWSSDVCSSDLTSKDSEPSPLTSLVSRSTNQSLHLGSPEFREPVKTIHRPSGDQLGDELLAWSKDMRSALRTLSFSTSSTQISVQ